MTWPEQAPQPAKALSASFSHAGHQDDRELGLEPIKHTARRLKAFRGSWGRWPRRKIAETVGRGHPKAPKQAAAAPKQAPKRQNAVNAPFSRLGPQNGETLDRATRKHAASQTNAFLGILRAPPACKIDSGTKKRRPRGFGRRLSLYRAAQGERQFCPDKATRRVGAEREDGKHKKAPRRKSGGAEKRDEGKLEIDEHVFVDFIAIANKPDTLAVDVFGEEILFLARFDIDRAVDQLGETRCKALVVLNFKAESTSRSDSDEDKTTVDIVSFSENFNFTQRRIEKLCDRCRHTSALCLLNSDGVHFCFPRWMASQMRQAVSASLGPI